MKTGHLLDELINITQISKSDFALKMDMSPSGLSKILSGNRLPFEKEKSEFSYRVAKLIADATFEYNCYFKFQNIFPIIYNFSTKNDLEEFLTCAVEYALDQDFAYVNNRNNDYPTTEHCYLGAKATQNMYCILGSDYLTTYKNENLEFYSTTPFYNKFYFEIFPKVEILSAFHYPKMSFNHLINYDYLDSANDDFCLNFLRAIELMQRVGDFNLWTIDDTITNSFLLLKGHFLITFSVQLDGTPIMTYIRHKTYLSSFYNSMMSKNARKLSFSRKEAQATLLNHPKLIDKFINRGIVASYNFVPFGFFLTKEELHKSFEDRKLTDSILNMLNTTMYGDSAFYLNIDSLTSFYNNGKLIVPLLGTVIINQKDRLNFFKRYDPAISETKKNKLNVLNCDLPKVSIIHADGLSIIYTTDSEYKKEKFHLVKTNRIHETLMKSISTGNLKEMNFNVDLWNSYLGELTSKPASKF